MGKGGAVYILTNKHHTTLYTGVTSNLWRRVNQHKIGFYPNSFTKRYNVDKLVYFEMFHSIKEPL
jgi:putative endonuclease